MAKVLVVKIKNKETKGPGCIQYKNEVAFLDFKQLATLFSDLQLNGANIDKAFREFQSRQKGLWPFE